jgi:hypothetical protein
VPEFTLNFSIKLDIKSALRHDSPTTMLAERKMSIYATLCSIAYPLFWS